MADQPLTVHLPDAILDPIRQIAAAKAQSIEQVIVDQLRSVLSIELPNMLPPDEESELVAFKFLSDDTLRNIAREQMPRSIQERMQPLMDRNNFGTIAPSEYAELAQLVERGNRLTLRKAWAAGVLMDRGHQITEKDFVQDE
ncbi:MAG: hypothetical protein ACYDBJ_25210 [Aggregatilineales bacterium]